jgi:hypothetical protein
MRHMLFSVFHVFKPCLRFSGPFQFQVQILGPVAGKITPVSKPLILEKGM